MIGRRNELWISGIAGAGHEFRNVAHGVDAVEEEAEGIWSRGSGSGVARMARR